MTNGKDALRQLAEKGEKLINITLESASQDADAITCTPEKCTVPKELAHVAKNQKAIYDLLQFVGEWVVTSLNGATEKEGITAKRLNDMLWDAAKRGLGVIVTAAIVFAGVQLSLTYRHINQPALSQEERRTIEKDAAKAAIQAAQAASQAAQAATKAAEAAADKVAAAAIQKDASAHDIISPPLPVIRPILPPDKGDAP